MPTRLLRRATAVLTLLVAASTAAYAQIPDPNTEPEVYEVWKQAAAGTSNAVAPDASIYSINSSVAGATSAASTSDALLIPYSSGGWTLLPKNDDGSTSEISLPFGMEFYGATYNSLFVNNNGNISFEEAYATFDPVGFPSSDFKMIAPFWGDVDTCDPGDSCTGEVAYKTTTYNGETVFVAHWQEVGFYLENESLRNTFQVVIASEATLPGGNNVCFGYGEMHWTTGDASGGTNGFGGDPATVGANKGDGSAFFQYGRFDHEGTDYDGPGGTTDGVSYLDGRQVCFNTGAAADNIPPVIASQPTSPITVNTGDPINFTVDFVPPEDEQELQSTNVSLGGGITFADVDCITTFGPPGGVTTVSCSGSIDTPGTYTVDITGTDAGSPSLSTTTSIVLEVTSAACNMPSIVSETVDNGARTVTVIFDAGDGATLSEISFRDPDGNPYLNNFTIVDADGFTPSDGYDYAPPGTPPNEATFVLEATAAQASYWAILTNDCGSVYNADPIHSFDGAARPVVDGNYPNPFHSTTSIRFQLSVPVSDVRVAVYDLMGREVARLHSGSLGSGQHELAWDATDASGRRLSSGVYLYRIEADDYATTRRMTLLK